MLETEINPNDEMWLSEVEAPQIITDPNLFAWDDEADLVVAGLGGAGIAAANDLMKKMTECFVQLDHRDIMLKLKELMDFVLLIMPL